MNNAVPSSAQQMGQLGHEAIVQQEPHAEWRSCSRSYPGLGRCAACFVPGERRDRSRSVMTRYALMPASMTVGQVIGVLATLSF